MYEQKLDMSFQNLCPVVVNEQGVDGLLDN